MPATVTTVPPTRKLPLEHGRTLTVGSVGGEELVEIRGSTDVLELRVRITDQGPVLQMESVHISLKAAESVNIECKEFNVNAQESVQLQSQGEMRLSGEADVRVDANGEVHVKGAMIYLN